MDPTAATILRHLESLGWAVSVHRLDSTIEMHAARLDGKAAPQVARCNDGDGEEEVYRAACLLSRACGVDLEDG